VYQLVLSVYFCVFFAVSFSKTARMGKKGRGKGKGSGRGGKGNVDAMIVNSHKATGTTTNVVRSDLSSRRQNFNIVSPPPKNFFTQTFWCELTIDTQFSVNAISIGEANQLFTAALFPGTTAFLAAFDQYCIYMVTATYSLIQSADLIVRIYTAIDYDSVTNIGKSGIQQFSTFNYTSLTQNDSLVRVVKPCIAPQVTSSNLPVPGGIGRAWLDSGFPNVSHYGIRNVIDVGASSIANIINVSYTAVFGWRNNI